MAHLGPFEEPHLVGGDVGDRGREVSRESRGNKRKDVPLGEGRLWIPKFTNLAQEGFDQTLSFLDADGDELIQAMA